MGIAKSAIAIALMAIPRRNRNVRRVVVSGGDVISITQCKGCGTFRSQPCDHVGHLCGGQRLSGDVVLPVGMAEVGASREYDCAQVLIADERKVGRIDDRADDGATLAVGAMTRLAA